MPVATRPIVAGSGTSVIPTPACTGIATTTNSTRACTTRFIRASRTNWVRPAASPVPGRAGANGQRLLPTGSPPGYTAQEPDAGCYEPNGAWLGGESGRKTGVCGHRGDQQ